VEGQPRDPASEAATAEERGWTEQSSGFVVPPQMRTDLLERMSEWAARIGTVAAARRPGDSGPPPLQTVATAHPQETLVLPARVGLNCQLALHSLGYASALSPGVATRSTQCRFRLRGAAAGETRALLLVPRSGTVRA
jgi:hypothetical protein